MSGEATVRELDEKCTPAGARLRLHHSLASKVNFATAQNGVAVVRSLALENTGDEAARNIRLTLTANPPMLRDKTWVIDRIAPGDRVELNDLDTPLDPAVLSGLDEAELGQLRLILSAEGLDDAATTHRVEMLARDEWGGLAEMDNVLAAFVSPNQPAVARILKDASRLLEAGGQSGAIDGYLASDPARVWMLAGAIWSAATGLGISYAVPPASFEQHGQKVRDPERILSEGLATCLDSSLLLAAAFEAAGLNTAVLFSHGHAWVGVWLAKRDFGRLVEPDVVTVRKAVTSREFVALESTLLTHRPAAGFEQAAAAGRDRLSEAREHEFIQAVDINRARVARIRPLASHRIADGAPFVADDPAAPASLPRPLDLGLLPGELVEEAPTTSMGRIERWQRKLLDLSLANRLLNFRETKGTVPMICPDLAGTEDRLAQGASFRLLGLKDENAVAGRDLTPDTVREIERDLATDALGRGQLAVPLTAREMTLRLTELYRKARSDMAEGGTNTLFLAVGFLRWKRTEGDARSYRAPLLLVPVKLERRSAQSEFRLGQLEDEVRINSTLLEMLKRDFELRIPELEAELPRDEAGLDISRIFGAVRARIRDVPGFEVVEDCALSTFSFAKYLMWKDLVDRTASLRESRLVAHLVDNPTEVFADAATPMPRPEQIDHRHAPGDLLAPLPADSSQLAAVVAAAEGRDFVLIGPPGTGKSQTITNIIADQLGRGRTVLFVAEKAAALDVVHRRLERHGLGDAVLELHSSKADRKSVLNQLGRSWDRASGARAQDWVQVAEDLRLTRDQLNAYVTALHRPGTQGFSVFQAIGKAAGGDAGFAVRFAGKDCHDRDSFRRLRALAETLCTRHRMVADLDPAGPIALIDGGEWSFSWQDSFLEAGRVLRAAQLRTADARARLAQALGLADEAGGAAAGALETLAAERVDQAGICEAAFENLDQRHAAVSLLANAVSRAAQARSRLTASYPDNTLDDIPLDTIDLQWREALTKSWPFAGMAQKKVRKLLEGYADGGTADPAADLPALRQLVRARAEITQSSLRDLPGFAGEASDVARLTAELDAAAAYLALEKRLIDKGLPADNLHAQRDALCAPSGGAFAPLLSEMRDARVAEDTAASAFAARGGAKAHGPDVQRRLSDLEALQPRFGDWLKWRASRAEAITVGLEPLVRALESGADLADPGATFETAYMSWWLRLALDAEPVLRGFTHWEHDALIARFSMLDDALAKLAPNEVMRRLGNGLPVRDMVPRNSELGILRHQLGLQRPTRAIRALIGDMPSTFCKLAPCVLMSPLSVAQYLPPGQAQFDVVIFDEASQISTWDAIGAIARGRQAIIVGDPKQLPPTNFFGRSDTGDDETVVEFEKDLPSILDEVAAAGIPTHRLSWHYRSRDEALIAFSNHHYYGGGLITFPSPAATGQSVRLHRVNGIYGRGTGSTNPEEARAIAAFIRERLTDWLTLPEAKRPTLGVITFNAQQQGLILDLLDAQRKADPQLEWFFADEREEPVIVKNLENIQGDERDVMLFSITFGPDVAGKITMNFGAMNQDGGEKRLNVAVTRARSELHVFSSLGPDQIDTGRTRARGVADMKAFLDFAERGPIASGAQDRGSLGPVESPFEESVRAALSARGWEVHTQIGVSGFRIDLAVRHPDRAGAWLAGIECDGAQYHGSATARDRDKIRQAVLEGLGWTILRIWSTDWFRGPVAAADRIDAALSARLDQTRAIEAARQAAAAEAMQLAEASQPQDDMPAVEAGGGTLESADEAGQPISVIDDTRASSHAGDDAATVSFDHPAQQQAAGLFVSPHHGGGHLAGKPDTPAGTQPAAATGIFTTDLDPDRFFDSDYDATLLALMQQVVAEQAPLPDTALARRITKAHGWQRTGNRIQARISGLAQIFDATLEGDVRFLWPRCATRPRVPFRGMSDRPLREISRAEIASVIEQHLDRISAAEDGTLELARVMGIGRLSRDARAYLDACRAWRAQDGAP